MRPHDLQAFQVEDDLLDRMAVTSGQLTDAERTTVLDRARDHLAREFDVSPDQAGRAMHEPPATATSPCRPATLRRRLVLGPAAGLDDPHRTACHLPPRAELG